MNEQVIINKNVAKKVMEWTAKYPERDPGDHFSAAGDSHRYGTVKARYPNGMTEDEFHPTSSISHAYIVIDKMRERGYYMSRVEHPRNAGVTIYFRRPEDFGNPFEEDEEVKVPHTREPLGICMAALRALK